jgi:hypothetical protein
MSRRAPEASLQDVFTSWLSDLGFAPGKPLQFVRREPNKKDILYFGVQQRSNKAISITYSAQIRFDDVAHILGDEHVENDACPIATWPHHLIPPVEAYFEWTSTANNQTDDLEKLNAHLQAKALPLFEWYQKKSVLLAELQSPSWLTSFVFGPEQRVTLMAALMYTNANKQQAIALLEAELTARSERPLKYRLPLQRLLNRLRSLDVAA